MVPTEVTHLCLFLAAAEGPFGIKGSAAFSAVLGTSLLGGISPRSLRTIFSSSISPWHHLTSKGRSLVSQASFSGMWQKPSQTPFKPKEEFSGQIHSPSDKKHSQFLPGWHQEDQDSIFLCVSSVCRLSVPLSVLLASVHISACFSPCGAASLSLPFFISAICVSLSHCLYVCLPVCQARSVSGPGEVSKPG